MALNRRSFVKIGSLVACGTAFNVVSIFAAPPRILKGGLPLSLTDSDVLDFVKSYASAVRIVGASVLGRLRNGTHSSLHLLAEVNDLSEMTAALPGAPFSGIFSSGNTISFTVEGLDVVVENLLPDVFREDLAKGLKRRSLAFAHDGLVFNVATNELKDPFDGAKGNVLKIVNKTFGGVAALDVTLRGTLEAQLIGLREGEDFANWKVRVLKQIVRAGHAEDIAEKFLQNIATLAEFLPTQKLKVLLKSRLVATALAEVFDLEAGGVALGFDSVRSTVSDEYSDASVWLALLLSAELRSNAADGAATTWLHNGKRADVLRSRKALSQARDLVNHPLLQTI